ncbi:MAG: GNAT family N-acetyltransferase [Acidimicrobiia bacterium]|nr:GNAT family N-acetyltransferase [Acidimicrobiia bacterium]
MDIRPIDAEQLESFFAAMSGPFGFDLPDDADARGGMLAQVSRIFEPERSRCAFDGDRMVGTLGTFSFQMTTPGGSMPVAGTTMVTVQTTHRRRGVMRAMMEAHLQESIERGDTAAALWASDSAIYGRFGYGMAAFNTELEIDRRHVDFHRLAPTPAVVEPVDVETLRPAAIEVYDRLRQTVPGMVGKSEGWWDRIFSDRQGGGEGTTVPRHCLVTEDGHATGWVRYRLKNTEGHGHPAQDVLVDQLYAVTPEAWAGAWQHVLSHDFGHLIKARLRPIDDPIHSLLRGMRRVKTTRFDGLFVRVLDVPAALGSRHYGTAGSVSLEVSDPMGIAPGTYRLETDGTASEISRVDDADIALDVEDLGALLLGGRSAVELARAGRIDGPDDQIDLLDRMFRWAPQPWSPIIF